MVFFCGLVGTVSGVSRVTVHQAQMYGYALRASRTYEHTKYSDFFS